VGILGSNGTRGGGLAREKENVRVDFSTRESCGEGSIYKTGGKLLREPKKEVSVGFMKETDGPPKLTNTGKGGPLKKKLFLTQEPGTARLSLRTGTLSPTGWEPKGEIRR